LDIDKHRDEIQKGAVRVDKRQSHSNDEKGRARNNIGAGAGDPGWYYGGPGGDAGGGGFGGVIGAPLPTGPGGYVRSSARRLALIDTLTTLAPRAKWVNTGGGGGGGGGGGSEGSVIYSRRTVLIETHPTVLNEKHVHLTQHNTKHTVHIESRPTTLNERHTRVVQQTVRQECRADQHFLLQRHHTTQVVKRPVEVHPETVHHFSSEARLRALEAQVAALVARLPPA
jgi:hypothetical protein